MTSSPTPFSCASPVSDATGLAERQSKARRRSTGSDSGSTKQPYVRLTSAIAPAAKNGRCRLMPPSSPPITGPRMKPMPNIAPIWPKRFARCSGTVMSAT